MPSIPEAWQVFLDSGSLNLPDVEKISNVGQHVSWPHRETQFDLHSFLATTQYPLFLVQLTLLCHTELCDALRCCMTARCFWRETCWLPPPDTWPGWSGCPMGGRPWCTHRTQSTWSPPGGLGQSNLINMHTEILNCLLLTYLSSFFDKQTLISVSISLCGCVFPPMGPTSI